MKSPDRQILLLERIDTPVGPCIELVTGNYSKVVPLPRFIARSAKSDLEAFIRALEIYEA